MTEDLHPTTKLFMKVIKETNQKQELIKALETLKEYCDKQCDMCRLKFVCMHYFDYGTMGGYADSALRMLRK